MQVSATTLSSTSAASGPDNTASQIAKLQKQLKDLAKQLTAVATSNLDAKAKQAQQQALQAQIAAIQQQIAALQNQEQQKQLNKGSAAPAPKPAQQPAANASLGTQVDIYA